MDDHEAQTDRIRLAILDAIRREDRPDIGPRQFYDDPLIQSALDGLPINESPWTRFCTVFGLMEKFGRIRYDGGARRWIAP